MPLASSILSGERSPPAEAQARRHSIAATKLKLQSRIPRKAASLTLQARTTIKDITKITTAATAKVHNLNHLKLQTDAGKLATELLRSPPDRESEEYLSPNGTEQRHATTRRHPPITQQTAIQATMSTTLPAAPPGAPIDYSMATPPTTFGSRQTMSEQYPLPVKDERGRLIQDAYAAPMIRYAREVEPDMPDRVFRPKRFDGLNPEAWISRVELYMMGAGVRGRKKLFWALACLEDDLMNWYSFSLGDRAPKPTGQV